MQLEDNFLERLRLLGVELAKTSAPIDPTEEIETVDASHEIQTAGAPVLVSTVTSRNLFRHPDAHPIVLDIALLKHYGPEWMWWEPETLEINIPRDLKMDVSEVNLGKINAVKTLHLVDTFWERWEVFLWCSMAMNGVPPDFVTMQVPNVAQCLVAVDIANRIRTDVDWSLEIKRYIEQVFRFDGIFCSLPPISFIDMCSYESLVDCADVSSKWPEVRASGKAPTEETITAEQLRRMLIVNHYLEESRAHLQQQLQWVNNV